LVRVLSPLIFIIVYAMSPNSSQAFNTYLNQKNPLCNYNQTNDTCLTRVFDEAGAPQNVGFCFGFTEQLDCDRSWGGLNFNDIQFSLIGTLSSVGSFLGNVIFQRWFINAGWHKLVTGVVFIATFSALLQLVLMFRDPVTGLTINERAHIPNVFFALGDDVIMAVTNQLLSMPILILMARLCPDGAEGTVYALVTSVQMVGGTVGNLIAQNLTIAFGVTNTNFHRLWMLTLVTSTTKMLCLFFLPLVPKELDRNDEDSRRHVWCGVFILSFFAGGLIWAVVQIILRVVNN